MKKPLDKQVGGKHYKNYEIQPMEFCYRNKLNCAQSAIIKYILRFRDKGGLDDLLKARHVLDMMIQFEYGVFVDDEQAE
jgi:hypothetical protein